MKFLNFLNNIFFKQYELRINSYLFCKNSIFIIFKPRFSRYKLIVPIFKVIKNKHYLLKIHPYDCYIIGILNRLLQENINPIQNERLLKINHNNEKISFCLNFIGIDYVKEVLQFEIGRSHTKHNIPIITFLKNTYIIRGLNSIESLKLGFTITDYLLNKDN